MKKPVKAPKKTGLLRKAAKNYTKKPTKPVKTTRKRRKTVKSDTTKAFLMVAVLIALSIFISMAFIRVRSTSKNTSTVENQNESSSVTVETAKPAPAVKPTIKLSEKSAAEPSAEKHPSAGVTETSAVSVSPPPKQNQSAAASSPQRPPERPVEKLGTLVFVIDDAGNNLRELEPFLRIPGPLTIAVLPGLPNSAEAARRIRAAGKEVFLHQPMEAIGAQDPGPGAIYSGMNAAEIKTILARNTAEIGPIAGINNHQGSKITMDTEAMRTILAFCAENGIHFLDSRTTADTVAPIVAKQIGMKIGERNVFLDNEQSRESMQSCISNGLERSQKTGSAVMIGHTWSPELAPLLAEQFPLLTKQGYTIKTASDIISK